MFNEKRVIQNLYHVLSKGEMLKKDYDNYLTSLLLREGFIGPEDDFQVCLDQFNDIAVDYKILFKTGLRNNYVTCEDSVLSKDAFLDVDDYRILKDRVFRVLKGGPVDDYWSFVDECIDSAWADLPKHRKLYLSAVIKADLDLDDIKPLDDLIAQIENSKAPKPSDDVVKYPVKEVFDQ